MAVDQAKIDRWFGPVNVRKEQARQQKDVRLAAKHFAESILQNTPPCADQSHAIRLVRLAMATANDSINCGGI